jgi:hypothetical protein
VTNTRGLYLNQHLAGPRAFEFHCFQAKGLACLASDSSAGLHAGASLWSTAYSGSGTVSFS